MQAAVPCLCSCTSSHFSAPLLVLFAREDFTLPELHAQTAFYNVQQFTSGGSSPQHLLSASQPVGGTVGDLPA